MEQEILNSKSENILIEEENFLNNFRIDSDINLVKGYLALKLI